MSLSKVVDAVITPFVESNYSHVTEVEYGETVPDFVQSLSRV
jgi:hypothetical protein